MATTKGKLIEQVYRIASGGDASFSNRFKKEDVALLVEQALNKVLKAERFANLNEGERGLVDLLLVEYDNVSVTTYKDTSKCTLPAIPVALPRGQGVYHVSGVNSPNDPYVPVQSGQWALIKNQRILGDLGGRIGYEVRGKELIFTKNLPGQSVNSVLIRLLVSDFSKFTNTELLPIPADMEDTVVRSTLEILGIFPAPDNKVDGVN
jgi:hypothetical protein